MHAGILAISVLVYWLVGLYIVGVSIKNLANLFLKVLIINIEIIGSFWPLSNFYVLNNVSFTLYIDRLLDETLNRGPESIDFLVPAKHFPFDHTIFNPRHMSIFTTWIVCHAPLF